MMFKNTAQVRVYYDPSNPEKAVLIPGIGCNGVLSAVLSVAMLVLAVNTKQRGRTIVQSLHLHL